MNDIDSAEFISFHLNWIVVFSALASAITLAFKRTHHAGIVLTIFTALLGIWFWGANTIALNFRNSEKIETDQKIEQLESSQKGTAEELENTKERLDSLKNYEEVAFWDCSGIISKGNTGLSGPAWGWTRGHTIRSEGKLPSNTIFKITEVQGIGLTFLFNEIQYKCNDEDIEAYSNTINHHPYYPCPYLVLSGCYRGKNDERWRHYAQQGLLHAEQTTKIKYHWHEHDQILHVFNQLLNQE